MDVQLSFKFSEDTTRAAIAQELRKQAALFETGGTTRETTNNDEAPSDFEPINLKAKKPKATAKAASFDDEQEATEIEAEETQSDDTEDFKTQTSKTKSKVSTQPAKKVAAKKLTVDDVNDACKAKAASIGGKAGREQVLTILKKKFKTTSVTELEPEQFEAAIAAIAAMAV